MVRRASFLSQQASRLPALVEELSLLELSRPLHVEEALLRGGGVEGEVGSKVAAVALFVGT